MLEVICGGVAGCFTANLGPKPKGLARSYYSSQQPTTIVCVFVYGEICHSNPICGGKSSGRFDSMCEGFYLKRDPVTKHRAVQITLSVSCLEMYIEVAVVKKSHAFFCMARRHRRRSASLSRELSLGTGTTHKNLYQGKCECEGEFASSGC